MFIDKVKISIKSGDGGNGAATFHREKYVPNGGPDGGDGGSGGSIIFKVDDRQNNLIDFHYKKKFVAGNGENGQKRNCNGKSAENLVITVPKGTIIRDFESGKIIADMFYDDYEKLVLKGGAGGKGNAKFTSSRRQAPSYAQGGERTKTYSVVLELKTIADVGLVGLPNVGKSTLLSKVSGAKPKIANYHFTTLSPNLGVAQYHHESFVVADIPGLIEGASEGAGLGHHFLRHIERTRMIIHVVDMSKIEGGDPYENFLKINAELAKYSPELAKKPQIIAANKMDCYGADEHYEEFMEKLGEGYEVFRISALTSYGLEPLIKRAFEILSTIERAEPLEFEEFTYEKDDITQYEISRAEDGAYEVTGPFVDYLSRTVNLDDQDSFNYFQRMLRENSVIERLREMGVEEGDLVVIGDIEFEFIN